VVVPVVLRYLTPHSVIDVGCGRGAWLRALAECGVTEIAGLDGQYVDRSRLLIDPAQFAALDLRRVEAVTGRYDLALCLEVAEHLPPESGAPLVEALTRVASVILFSAAIPGQGGAQHVNEQWPAFWHHLFADRGYRALDAIRPCIRADPLVDWWYRQNLLVYASEEGFARWPSLASAPTLSPGDELEWVHRRVVDELLRRNRSIRDLTRTLVRRMAERLLGRRPWG